MKKVQVAGEEFLVCKEIKACQGCAGEFRNPLCLDLATTQNCLGYKGTPRIIFIRPEQLLQYIAARMTGEWKNEMG